MIEDRGLFLIAHSRGASNTYLPGGHVDPGESLKNALARELEEELGITALIGKYLGVVEHSWDDAGGSHHEINHMFEAASAELASGLPPNSLESHIEFLWLRQSEFDEHNLQPSPLRILLQDRDGKSGEVWWASTLGEHEK